MVALVRIWADFLSTLLYLTRPYSDKMLNFFYRFFMGKTKPLPPIENQILLLSATELAAKIRKRQLKSEDVVRAYVERAKVVQPHINAIVDARYEDALEDSRIVDRFLQRNDKSPEEIEKSTPLLGVPFTCKEAIGVKGMSQTAGLVEAKTRKAEVDSDSAAQYREAGAIPVTVTNVPELCMWYDSSNLTFGITLNPYDSSRTVGGSSGGEAALLSSAGAVIGIGNDLGGSIRMPSSFCGIYGHKPTTGVVSNAGDFPYDEEENKKVNRFVSTGPMCRYAKDLPLLLKVLSADDKRLSLQKNVDFRKVKIYYMGGFPGRKPAPDIVEAVKKAANYFEETHGIKAIPLEIEELEYAFDIWECKLLETDILPFTAALVDKKGRVNLWWELLKSVLRLSNHTIKCYFFAMINKREKDIFYYECLRKYKEIERRFQEIFQEDAIVLVPTHPEVPPHYITTLPRYSNVGYTAIFNILGFPVTNVPTGMSDGVPLGIQVISGHFQDHLTISAAIELDKLFGGWKSPCSIQV